MVSKSLGTISEIVFLKSPLAAGHFSEKAAKCHGALRREGLLFILYHSEGSISQSVVTEPLKNSWSGNQVRKRDGKTTVQTDIQD